MPRSNVSNSKGVNRYRYRFAAVVFDEAKQELIVGGLVVEVQLLPLRILSLLLSRGGEVVPRQDFFEKIWDGRPTVDNVLPNAIKKLRNALGVEAAALIETVPRLGYRFAGHFERTLLSPSLFSDLRFAKGKAVPVRPQFVFERQLSRVGGHEVWLAVDLRTKEARVYKFAADPQRVAALKREATIARLLRDAIGERSDIVRVVGWNFDHQPYFLESEFAGDDLLRWAEGGDLARATTADRLAIVLQVADALAAAHSVGVLHKDLKPENVLIHWRDGWQVRLADFGSGQLLEPERLTQLGITALGLTITEGLTSDATRGTIMYLAPEILQDQPATVSSDLYALGVLLYQMLLGDLRRPLAPGWEGNITDELLREDIAGAANGNPLLRVASVQDWATHLRRIEERRSERTARRAAQREALRDFETARQARARRPWVVGTVTALCIGLAGTLFLFGRVRLAERALARQYTVSSALNTLLIDDFIAIANPTVTGRRDITLLEAVRHAAANIDATFAGADPQVRGGLHAAMQDAFAGLGQLDDAIAEGHKALDALKVAIPPDRQQMAEVRVGMAGTLALLSQQAQAATELENAAALIKEAHLEDSALAARYWWARGGVELSRLAVPQGLEDDRIAWEMARRHPELRADLRDQIHFSYADALRSAGNFVQAAHEAQDLLSRQQVRLGLRHPLTCYTGILHASILGYQQQPAEALAAAEPNVDCLRETLGEQHLRTANAYKVLADLNFQADHYADAANTYEKLAHTLTTLTGPQSQRAISARMNAGVSIQYAGQLVRAEGELTDTLETARAALGWEDPTVQNVRYHLADCRLDLRKTADVAELLGGLSTTALNQAQIEPDWDARLAYQLGRLALYSGDPERAIPFLQSAAITIGAKNPGGRVTEAAVRQLIQSAETALSPVRPTGAN